MSWSLFGTACAACKKRTRGLVNSPSGASTKSKAMVCKVCFARLRSEGEAKTKADEKLKSARLGKELLAAASLVRVAEIKSLIAAGADVNARNEDSKTVLMQVASFASDMNCVDVLRALTDAGADVNAKDRDGNTALWCAQSFDCVDTLIDAGADVDAKNKDGETALMCHAKKGRSGLIETLIDAGADVSATDNHGKTALELARLRVKDPTDLNNVVIALRHKAVTLRRGAEPVPMATTKFIREEKYRQTGLIGEEVEVTRRLHSAPSKANAIAFLQNTRATCKTNKS